MSRDKTDLALFGLLAAFWGGSFVAIKFVVRDFPPTFGAMLRVGVALLVLWSVFRFEGRGLRAAPAQRRRMWLAGLFAQGIPFCLLFWGERRISPGLAGIINGTVPLWTFLLGLLAGSKETLSGRSLLGLALGFLGIVSVFSPLLIFGGTQDELLGAAAVLLMAVSYGVGALMSRAELSGKTPADFRANVYHQHCASFVFLAAVSASAERWPSLSALAGASKALLSVAYLGIFSTAAAFLIFYHLIRRWGAVRASAVTYVAPVMALFWDFVFFATVPRPSEALGVSAILGGVILLHFKDPASVRMGGQGGT